MQLTAHSNALAESFFATLECELIDRRSWPTKSAARMALFTYIEGWYNPRRCHSALGQRSLIDLEELNAHQFKLQRERRKDGLPNRCFAPVDSPLDNPASEVIEPA